jgi:hypothetical protein
LLHIALSLGLVALAAIMPYVYFSAHNRNEIVAWLPELSISVSITLAFAVSVLAITKLVWKRAPLFRIANAIAVFLFLFFSYTSMVQGLGVAALGTWAPLASWLLLTAIAITVIWYLPATVRSTAIIAAIGSIMVGSALVQAWLLPLAKGNLESAVASNTNYRHEPPNLGSSQAGQKRNVYFFLLDAYARHDVLKDVHGIDNSAFIHGLKERGFYIAERSHSNFPQTVPSLLSTFFADYFYKEGDRRTETIPVVQEFLLGNNPVVRRFRQLGYNIIRSEYPFWGGRCGGREDVCIPLVRGILNDYYHNILKLTPLTELDRFRSVSSLLKFGYQAPDPDEIVRRTTKLQLKPFFLYAHLLTAHDPYLHKQDCSFLTDWMGQARTARGQLETLGWMPLMRKLYSEHLLCSSQKFIVALEKAIENDPDGIFIVQADHGIAFGDYYKQQLVPINDWSENQVRQQFAILSAFRLPTSCRHRLYPSISPVNTFRLVFSCLTGDELKFLPDEVVLIGAGQPSPYPVPAQVWRGARP